VTFVSVPPLTSAAAHVFERPERDLAAEELWRRSVSRSRERRALAARGLRAPRSLISAAIPDLDAPSEYLQLVASFGRDLSDDEVWDLSLACARARRSAAQKGLLQQARAVSAPLVVAAVAGLAAAQGSAHTRSASERTSQTERRLLKLGTRGADVKRVQRALRIPADGIFGPQTRRAVRAFQKRHNLAVDGIVGPQTRAALFVRGQGAEMKLIRAWWVAPVQRKLGVPADGIYGPVTRGAVRSYQTRHGLIVDGIVGPQTLGHLGISRSPQAGGTSGPASISRSLWDDLGRAKTMGLRLISGYRAGATIGGGGVSDHARYPSRAIDVAGSPAAMRRYALATAGRSGIKYVIYSPLGMWGNWSRSWRPVSGETRAAHFSHVHVSATG
jgi:peptidoglycan hydrolase-like protein with peptidoglycan-binding domain